MAKKIIQTTPDIGLKIKLQRLKPEADAAPVTCNPCSLTRLWVLNLPFHQTHDRPTVEFDVFLLDFYMFIFPEGNFSNTDIAWSWSWDGDDLSQWIDIEFDDQLPGLLSAHVDACCNEGGDNFQSTLTISATCSNSSSAAVAIDFLVNAF